MTTAIPGIENARVVVVLFTMNGCPACHEFRPRFRKLAEPYGRYMPIVMADVDDPRFEGLAERLQVRELPVTFALRRPHGMIRVVGNVPDAHAKWLLDVAAHEAVYGSR
jgi:thioredoxin-like negative regulator of GroEL